MTSADSAELLGGYHKRIILFEYINKKEEGVGSRYGILNSCKDSYGGTCSLFSAFCDEKNDILIYQDPGYAICHFDVPGSILENYELDISVAPNPAYGYSDLQIDDII